jgi:uncharacterized protein (TIGR03083 family)
MVGTKDLWVMIAEERVALADVLDGLTDDQWSTPSLCEGWSVRDVAAHLVMPFSLRLPRLLGKLAASRFDFDRFTFNEARGNVSRGPELAVVLRDNAEHRFAPPGLGPIAPLTDIVVHGQDVCRPLGINRPVLPDRAEAILRFLSSAKATHGFVSRTRVRRLTWRCPEIPWSWGCGPEIAGSAESVILALTGRRVAAELSGPGVEVLCSR